MDQIIVTTGDITQPYDILGPVYFQVSNKGLFGSSLDKLKSRYYEEIKRMKSQGNMSESCSDWGFLYGEWSVGQNDFEAAFFIATEELKKRAKLVGADAIICMRQDIDMDTNGFAYFYLQMYGTAVKFKNQPVSFGEQYDKAEELMSKGNFAEAENIYFQLGDFRDSKEKAKAAYTALLLAKYNSAEEMMRQKNYPQAEQLFISLRDYKDAKEKADQAHRAHEDWMHSITLSQQKAAEEKQNQKRSWTCPACGKENVYFAPKCSCGHTR